MDEVIIASFTDGSNGRYEYYEGTSMATPNVAGLASLAWAYRPDLSFLDIKNAILNNGDSIASLSGKTVTGKRINAYKTLISLTNPKVSNLKVYSDISKAQEITDNSWSKAITPLIEWDAPVGQGIISSYDIRIDYSSGYTLSGSINPEGNFYSGSLSSASLSGVSLSSNGVYNLFVRGVNDGGKTGEWTSSKINIDTDLPVISQKAITNISQTGAHITFHLADTNFANGSGTIVAYTGSNIANLAESGALSLTFSGGSGTGDATFSNLKSSTTYEYLISLTDTAKNITTNTGAFTTASAPVDLSGGDANKVGITTLTGTLIGTGETLSLSGTNLVINSNPQDSQFITGSLSISGTNISVTGQNAWNGILIPPTLIDNSTQEAATGNEIGSGITVIQTIKTGGE